MDTLFWYKLLQSFLAGSIWVTATTLIAENFGSKIGGFVGGLPSTIVIALLFIGLTQSPQDAIRATTVVPLMMGFNGIFMVLYLLNVKRGFALGLTSALVVWAMLVAVLVFSRFSHFGLSITGWAVLILACYLAVEKFANIPAHGKVVIHYSTRQIVFRGLFAGILIAFAVLMSKIGGPVLGGIFAVFPAIFISTIVITYHSGGAAFSRAVVKALMLSGMINVGIYAISVRYLYNWLGLWLGTGIAIAVSMVTGYLVFLFIRKWLK